MANNTTEKPLPPRLVGVGSKELFAPFEPPFRYDREGQMIFDANNQLLLDVRGHGYLTGMGGGALHWDEERAAQKQDDIGEHVARLLNTDCGANGKVSE